MESWRALIASRHLALRLPRGPHPATQPYLQCSPLPQPACRACPAKSGVSNGDSAGHRPVQAAMSAPPPQIADPQQLESLLPLLMMLAPELAPPHANAAAAPAAAPTPAPTAAPPTWPPSAQLPLPAGLPFAQLGDASALLPLLGAVAGQSPTGAGRHAAQQAAPPTGAWPPSTQQQQEWLRVPSPPPPLPQQGQLGTLESLRELLLPALRDPLLPHQQPPPAAPPQPTAWAAQAQQQRQPQPSPALWAAAAAAQEHASAFGSPTPAPSPPPAPGAFDEGHEGHEGHEPVALPFQPVATRSVQAALASAVPAGLIRGAREQSGVYQVRAEGLWETTRGGPCLLAPC